MKAITIGNRISSKDHENGATTIVVLPKRELWKEALLTLWLAGFTFIGAVAIYILVTGVQQLNAVADITQADYDNQKIYLLVFIGFWFYFEFKVARSWFWYRFGKELLKIDQTGLSIKKSIFGYGKAKSYLLENIKKFSLIKEEENNFGNFFENSFWSLGTDKLTFEYFGKVKTFGRRVEDEEGRLLQRLIDDRVRKQLKRK